MATENPLWGEARIANELLLKHDIRISPRTVRTYMPKRPRGDQRWATFLRNHAQSIIACDFFVAVTATFRLLNVFVLIHHGSRRLVHLDVTAHPTAAWTIRQLREAIGFDWGDRYLIHDRDSIFARTLDASLRGFGLRMLKSPRALLSPACAAAAGAVRRRRARRGGKLSPAGRGPTVRAVAASRPEATGR